MKNEGTKKIYKIEYQAVGGKVEYIKEILKLIPKQFWPSKKTTYILITLIVIITGFGIMQSMMPITKLSFSLDTNAEPLKLEIHVGWPWQFFGTVGEDSTKIKMDIINAILDLIILTIISYFIEILINLLISMKLTTDPNELKKKPKVIMFKEKTAGEKVAEKITQKVIKTEEKKVNTEEQTNNLTNNKQNNNTEKQTQKQQPSLNNQVYQK